MVASGCLVSDRVYLLAHAHTQVRLQHCLPALLPLADETMDQWQEGLVWRAFGVPLARGP
eukprot:5117719-Lingulodinium_polyedra.AAC.1